MVDKLDLRVPRLAPFSAQFQRLYTELRAGQNDPFRAGKYYEYAADLREYGYSARLHTFCRMEKSGNHKLELIDVGQMGRQEIVGEIVRIFSVDPLCLGVMRVDFAVDVQGLPVQWFRETVRVGFKRFRSSMSGERFYCEMGSGEIETLYFGKRPNLIRIYDKRAEYRHAYKGLVRSLGRGAEPPSFESIYGAGAAETVLTRVERQIGGRVPSEIATLRAVVDSGTAFRPFGRLRVIDHAPTPPGAAGASFETYCTGMYLRRMAEEDGMQAVGAFLSRHSNGNAAWAWKKYGGYLPGSTGGGGLTSEALQRRFEVSLARQMNR